MWFILVFALSGLALQIGFEIAKSGADNILTRSGEEIRSSKMAAHFRRLTETVSDGALATISFFGVVVVLGIVWKLLRIFVNLF